MEKLTKIEKMTLKLLLKAEMKAEESKLEEMEQKKERTVFELSAIAYSKNYLQQLKEIIEKI